MAEPTFGFTCGKFFVALSDNNIIMPGSKGRPLRQSLVPTVQAGRYQVEAASGGEVFVKWNVIVHWVGHPKEPEPFLGLETDLQDTEDVVKTLRAYEGRKVDLAFTPLDETKSA